MGVFLHEFCTSVVYLFCICFSWQHNTCNTSQPKSIHFIHCDYDLLTNPLTRLTCTSEYIFKFHVRHNRTLQRYTSKKYVTWIFWNVYNGNKRKVNFQETMRMLKKRLHYLFLLTDSDSRPFPGISLTDYICPFTLR